MKSLLTILLLLGCFGSLLVAQEATFRSRKPFAAKVGFEGAGLDVTLANRIGFDVTSWVLFNATKIRLIVFDNNDTPFIGIGYGSTAKIDSGSTSWTAVFVGFERSYDNYFLQFIIQVPIHKADVYEPMPFFFNRTPTFFNINVGMRF